MGGTRWIQGDAETKEDKPQRVVVSFGPEYAPLEQRQVAIEEANRLVPKPKIIVFAAFQFDPEAADLYGRYNPDKFRGVWEKLNN